MSCRCGDPFTKYSDEWDAYYCGNCWEWLEQCCGDPDCDYCSFRPSDAYEYKIQQDEDSYGDLY